MIFLRALIIVILFGSHPLFGQPTTEPSPQEAKIKDENINAKLEVVIKQAEKLLKQSR